jgi:hypothetical protein
MTVIEIGNMELFIKKRKTTRMPFTKTYSNLMHMLSEQGPSEGAVRG